MLAASASMDWKTEVQRRCRVVSFGSPCSPEQIDEVEGRLASKLPPLLRDLYLAFDGFRGPTSSRFFWTLDLLADSNLALRGESWAPSWARNVVFFGDNGVGGTIGVQWGVDLLRPDEAFGWSLDSGDERELLGTVFDVWEREQGEYDAVAAIKKK